MLFVVQGILQSWLVRLLYAIRQRPFAAQFEALVFIPAEQNKCQQKLDQLGRGQTRTT